MSDFLDRMNASESHAKLTELRQRMEAVNLDLLRGLDAARRYTDRDLTPEGLRKRREELADAARQKAATALDALRGEQRQAAARIRSWAAGKRPTVGDDPVQVTKVQAGWERARAMLDAGRPVAEVLSTATDPALVLAVREYAGDWLAASAPRAPGMDGYRAEPPDVSGLVRSADDRLAELHGGDTAAALRMLRDLDVAEAGWQGIGASVGHQVAGGTETLASAVAAHYAEQSAGAGFQQTA